MEVSREMQGWIPMVAVAVVAVGKVVWRNLYSLLLGSFVFFEREEVSSICVYQKKKERSHQQQNIVHCILFGVIPRRFDELCIVSFELLSLLKGESQVRKKTKKEKAMLHVFTISGMSPSSEFGSAISD
jgi:hypothetical protein